MLRNIGNVHQFVNHIHHLYTDLTQNMTYQNALKNIRVKYILSRISEDEFSAAIFREHKKDSKNQKKKQLLQMVDNVGTDLLQNYNAFLDKKVKRNQMVHVEQMIELINAFTKIVLYFNELSSKYHWEFNSFIGYINIIVNNTQINNDNVCLTPVLIPHDVIKYRY
jgi:Cft2 family RNA processing exonuclease